MFNLTKISDLIRLPPDEFSLPLSEALEDLINAKYSNKVIHNVGLCITLYDILEFEDGLTRNGDGSVYIKTTFRLVVFRPFVGEILIGWVSSCTEEGLNVKMEFFDDIFIPKHLLFESCVFIPREQAWVWKNGDDDFYIDTNEKIRFRVEQEVFTQHQPKNPGTPEDEQQQHNSPPSYMIQGSCQSDGLGLVTWWD
ncbi:similar to Saccharomyces cerevisiae YKL144C RPC25 RNA polymerase III subunit C25 [Geotrichum candidum]|uniref:DNA-directed RNA polymerase subunit n=1 Tax=Geotrichum candidum TaxID=1173061 RepID=A0A0J9XGA0_GEOCN|nr:similar to Saccharomyces cerevisiae YKL144C RPC25 RNA polymerase III subunit C25 [Geotrichum candidum]